MPSRAYVTRVSPEDFRRHINSSSDTHTYTFFPNGSTGTRQTSTPSLIIRRNWKAYPGPTYPCLVCGRGYSRSGVAVQWSSCSRWFCMTPTCSSTTPRTLPPLPGCDASARIHTPSLTHLTSPVLLLQILPSSGAQPSQAPIFVLDQAPLLLRLTFLPGNRPFLYFLLLLLSPSQFNPFGTSSLFLLLLSPSTILSTFLLSPLLGLTAILLPPVPHCFHFFPHSHNPFFHPPTLSSEYSQSMSLSSYPPP